MSMHMWIIFLLLIVISLQLYDISLDHKVAYGSKF